MSFWSEGDATFMAGFGVRSQAEHDSRGNALIVPGENTRPDRAARRVRGFLETPRCAKHPAQPVPGL